MRCWRANPNPNPNPNLIPNPNPNLTPNSNPNPNQVLASGEVDAAVQTPAFTGRWDNYWIEGK